MKPTSKDAEKAFPPADGTGCPLVACLALLPIVTIVMILVAVV